MFLGGIALISVAITRVKRKEAVHNKDSLETSDKLYNYWDLNNFKDEKKCDQGSYLAIYNLV